MITETTKHRDHYSTMDTDLVVTGESMKKYILHSPESNCIPQIKRVSFRFRRNLHFAIFSVLSSFLLCTAGTATDFSGNLKGVNITDAQGTNIPPAASFTYTVKGDTVTFDANSSTDADGSISKYIWDFGDGSGGSGAQTNHTYSAKITIRATLTLVDNNNGIAVLQKALVFQAPVNLAVNFQPAGVDIPTGFMADSGSSFDTTKGYGWTTLPASQGTRDRNSSLSPDQSYDTMIHVAPNGKWEANLPSGTYTVTICAGDPGYPFGTPSIQVEGNIVMAGEVLSKTMMWIKKTSQIEVTDGRLTLTFTGSTDPARLCWVKIQSL